MRLDRKIAVISGGASGIGEAIAVRLRAAGATVAVLERHRPPERFGVTMIAAMSWDG